MEKYKNQRVRTLDEDNFVHFQTIINFKIDKRNGQVIHERGFTRPILDSKFTKKKKVVKELVISDIQESIEM